MADILDKRPVNAEMTIFKTEVEPNKLNACIDDILMRLNRLETKFADVQPVKCGRWICEFYNDVFDVYQADCSVCKRESTDKYDKVSESYEYCPHCGARMDSEKK